MAAVHHEDNWTCSFTDVRRITIRGAAPALRVEWATSSAAFARGESTVAVFPDDPGLFWFRLGPVDPIDSPIVELGHQSCFGYTIPADAIHSDLLVRVTPLYADGSAGEPSDIVRVIELLPWRLAGDAPPPRALAPAGQTWRTWIIAMASGLLLGIALAPWWRRPALRVAVLAAVTIPACAALALLTGMAAWPAWLAGAAAALGLPVLIRAAVRRRPGRA